MWPTRPTCGLGAFIDPVSSEIGGGGRQDNYELGRCDLKCMMPHQEHLDRRRPFEERT